LNSIKILFVVSAAKDISAFAAIIRSLKNDPQVTWRAVSFGNVKTITKSPEAFERAAKECRFNYMDITSFCTHNILSILQTEQPSILVICNEEPFIERAFVLASTYLKIPTLLLQNGTWINLEDAKFAVSVAVSRLLLFRRVLNAYSYYLLTSLCVSKNPLKTIKGSLSFVQLLRNRKKGLACSRCAVTGSVDKQLLLSEGVESSRVFVTGNPAFDSVINTRYDRVVICKKLGLDPKGKIAVFLTSAAVEHQLWTKKMNDEFTEIVLFALLKVVGLQVIIKVHPAEKCSTYTKYRQQQVAVCQDQLNPLLQISDIVLTYHSTAALTAIMLNKPLVDLNLFSEREVVPYVTYGVALPACSGPEITQKVADLLYNEHAKQRLAARQVQFQENFAKNADGKASQRCIALIKQIVAQTA
jgi:hypothetical protein